MVEHLTADQVVPGSNPGVPFPLDTYIEETHEKTGKENVLSRQKLVLSIWPCIGGESNPGLPRGRREFYHWTTNALRVDQYEIA